MPEEKVKMLGDKMPEEKGKKYEKKEKPPKDEKKHLKYPAPPPPSPPPSPAPCGDKSSAARCDKLSIPRDSCPGYSCGCAEKAKRVLACPPSPPSPPSPLAPPEYKKKKYDARDKKE